MSKGERRTGRGTARASGTSRPRKGNVRTPTRAQIEARASHSERLLATAQQITHIGSWEWTPATNSVIWSDELYRIYGLDPHFIGPAAIALAQRYNLDNRDEGASERMRVLSEHDGIWGCTFVGECTKVCPKHVDPAAAIQRYKLQSALDWVKGVVLPRAAS